MVSGDADPATVVLRPSWHASAAVGPLVAVNFVVFALVFDDSVVRAVVSATVFGVVFAVLDRKRTVVLTDAEAMASDLWRQRSVARTEVRDVDRGPWRNGGIRLSTGGKDCWLRVGDLPFGLVSDQRLAVVKDWASTANVGQ